jgi:hypothetical protein
MLIVAMLTVVVVIVILLSVIMLAYLKKNWPEGPMKKFP